MKFCLFWPTSPHFTLPLGPENHNFTLCFHELDSFRCLICDTMQCLAFYDWLITLFSAFNHLVANGRIFFFLEWIIFWYVCVCCVVCVYHICFNCSFITRNYVCFHNLVNVSNAAMNMGVSISLQDTDSISFAYIRSEIVTWKDVILMLWEPQYFFQNGRHSVIFMYFLVSPKLKIFPDL